MPRGKRIFSPQWAYHRTPSHNADHPISHSLLNMNLPGLRRVAIIHDWLIDFAGSERVLEQILHLFPHADLFTLVNHMPSHDLQRLQFRTINTSFLQCAPGIAKHLSKYLPLMPLAIEQFDLTGYDLIISSSHCVAKGVIVPPDALHLCYCHSPMRYAWDMQSVYLRTENLWSGPSSWFARATFHYLRQWDSRTGHGVDAFAANSDFVAKRILKSYRRDAAVIHPPVELCTTAVPVPFASRRANQLVTLGRLVGYKNVELMCQAMERLPEHHLTVIGDGPLKSHLIKIAPNNVQFVGHLPSSDAQDLIRHAQGFLFCAVEDFGIAPVEALGLGTPVIAPSRGGARDYIQAGENGIFISELNATGVAHAISELGSSPTITPERCRESSQRFSSTHFKSRLGEWVENQWSAWQTSCT